eukprot:scaffold5078_cov63-Phaeocystis_antarctica.AAC.16
MSYVGSGTIDECRRVSSRSRMSETGCVPRVFLGRHTGRASAAAGAVGGRLRMNVYGSNSSTSSSSAAGAGAGAGAGFGGGGGGGGGAAGAALFSSALVAPPENSVKTGEKSVSSKPFFSAPPGVGAPVSPELELAWLGPGERGVPGCRGDACVIIPSSPPPGAGDLRPGVSAPPDGDQSSFPKLPRRLVPRGVIAGRSGVASPSAPASGFARGESMAPVLWLTPSSRWAPALSKRLEASKRGCHFYYGTRN